VEIGVNVQENVREHSFRKDIEDMINIHSKENSSNTPDFILAEYLSDCLEIFDKAVNKREKYFEDNPTWK